ncbi:hypothetical protein ISN44_As07g005870 [Arabidopsis suecica]|uniref:Uncharacterized protein n=1 Tax=Arabidopsis suecica TaxID=45249 RepID=A0A8T2BTI1_ARASU|nr:hypothetical protein ISN44_As07g005870 [Arabidopsis suecica]
MMPCLEMILRGRGPARASEENRLGYAKGTSSGIRSEPARVLEESWLGFPSLPADPEVDYEIFPEAIGKLTRGEWLAVSERMTVEFPSREAERSLTIPEMSLSDSSDSSRGRNIPVHERKIVWSSPSEGPEASLSDRSEPNRDSAAESSSEGRDPSRFVAREDAIANVARDEELPDDPEATLNERRMRPPATDEAGGSRWKDVPEPSLLPVKAEAIHYDSDAEARMLRARVQAAKAQQQKMKPARKVKRPDPPGSTLSTEDSLRDLRARFGFSEGINMRLPTPSERADSPPAGFFTLYEGFFHFCFLWFPLPRLIVEYLWSYKIALAEISTRGLRHLVGILVRSFEADKTLSLGHLRNFLEIRRNPGPLERYYISPSKNKTIIGGFPSKDEKYTDHFFFVAIDEDSVPEDCLHKIVAKWGIIDISDLIVLNAYIARCNRGGEMVFGSWMWP